MAAYEIGVVLAPAIASFLFFYLYINMDIKNQNLIPLRTLFFFLGIFFMIGMFALARTSAETGGASTATTNLLDSHIVWMSRIIYITLAYFILMFLWSVLEAVDIKKKYKSRF